MRQQSAALLKYISVALIYIYYLSLDWNWKLEGSKTTEVKL